MTPRTRCAASGTMARSSGKASWCCQRGPQPRAGGPGGNRAGGLARAVHAPRTGAHRSRHASVYAGVARSAAWDVTATVKTAVEMPSLWKPHTGFHSDLEISHRARDSHIPTADRRGVARRRQDPGDRPESVTYVSGLLCYRCIRLRRMRLGRISQMRCERAPRASHANGARRRRGARESV